MRPELEAFVAAEKPRVNAALEHAVERLAPPIGAAAIYSVRAGGKRVRPLLTVASYRAVAREEMESGGACGEAVYDIAAAVELIHTYSLLHDDLPCMDNDQMRRGLPTVHRAYGVGVATAAGCALQQLAFLTLARAGGGPPQWAGVRTSMLRRLGIGAGIDGMVGGQYLDLLAEGRELDGPGLEAIHRAKTAALISTACALGGLAAGAAKETVTALADYGTYLGLAFQIVDDLLDEIGDPARMGKTAGADRVRGKATYPAVYGIEEAARLAAGVSEEARARLASVGDAPVLEGFVDYVLERLH